MRQRAVGVSGTAGAGTLKTPAQPRKSSCSPSSLTSRQRGQIRCKVRLAAKQISRAIGDEEGHVRQLRSSVIMPSCSPAQVQRVVCLQLHTLLSIIARDCLPSNICGTCLSCSCCCCCCWSSCCSTCSLLIPVGDLTVLLLSASSLSAPGPARAAVPLLPLLPTLPALSPMPPEPGSPTSLSPPL